MSKISKQIEAAMDREDWVLARRLLNSELVASPDNHWLVTRLGMTYYEQRNYRKALTSTKRALKLAPACPLVRWDHACALDMCGRVQETIREWKRLVKIGARALGPGQCGEGVRWARGLVNDSKYRLALAHGDIGDVGKATLYGRAYLRGRSSASIYDEGEANGKLSGWLQDLT
jgi:tetratricopeptide (TPR) repeat protein